MTLRLILLSFGALSLAGCSGLHSDGPPVQTYILRAAEAPRQIAPESGAAAAQTRPLEQGRSSNETTLLPSVQLPRPSADPGLGTELITLVRSDRRMDYYSGSRWAANLPQVVETLAIDTLRASGRWGAVHDSPSSFLSDFILQINIRRFEADYTDGGPAPTVHVVLDCILARRSGRQLVTAFTAAGAANASENRLGAVVAAFEKAANAALAAMSERSAAAAAAVPPSE